MRDFARAVAIAAGAGILAARQDRDRVVDLKGRRDLVTAVDRRVEAFLAARIAAAYPDDAILAEESIRKPGRSGRAWIIDPLDGTTNFVHGHPLFCVSIALTEGDRGLPPRDTLAGDPRASGFFDPRQLPRPRLAVVYAPVLGELFWAEHGGGAYLSVLRCPEEAAAQSLAEREVRAVRMEATLAAQRLRVSRTARLEDALVATGFAYRRNELGNSNLGNFATLALRARGIRRGGSAALDLCFVAAGRFDAFWELYLKPWDVAAGMLLVSEAGGRVSDFSGGERALEGVEILATNGLLHEEVRSLLEGADPEWAAEERQRI